MYKLKAENANSKRKFEMQTSKTLSNMSQRNIIEVKKWLIQTEYQTSFFVEAMIFFNVSNILKTSLS